MANVNGIERNQRPEVREGLLVDHNGENQQNSINNSKFCSYFYFNLC